MPTKVKVDCNTDRSSRHEIDYVMVIKTFLISEGHHNRIIGAKSYGNFTEGGDFAYGGAALGRVVDKRGYAV